MKLYLVLWCGATDNMWMNDGLFAARETAEAKLAFEKLAHPTWKHCIVEVDAPAIVEEQA